MATKEQSIIETVEKQLSELQSKKSENASALTKELATAKSEYDTLVSEIQTKYNVTEIEEEIKRHTYFHKLLKGEVKIPDDMNAKKGKATSSTTPTATKSRTNWVGKFEAVYKKLGKTTADNVTTGQVKLVLPELYPELKDVNPATLNAALIKFKKDNAK